MTSLYKKFLKRPFDFLMAILLLCILSPLLLVVALLIKTTSKGPIFFTQERVGQYQKKFVIYKFRSFKKPTPFDIDNPVISRKNTNVTLIGKIIRQLKIDELPQLINIVKGDMSFIGPRPFVDIYLKRYADWEYAKFAVKPGLTGLSQIKGNGHLKREERSYWDIKYTQCGLWTEFVIVFKSVFVVLLGEKHFYKPLTQEQLNTYTNLTKPEIWKTDYKALEKQRHKNIQAFLDYVKTKK